MHRFVIICFLLFNFTIADDEFDHISINSDGGGRNWSGDAAAADPFPYATARIYRSQLDPGQKFIRLHFNPAPYPGFQSSADFFTVEVGPFTQLANFSASITARALSLNILAKEFCIIALLQSQPPNTLFSPETSQSMCSCYASTINGIEIISNCHGGDSRVDDVLGEKTVISTDNATALERVYHQNMQRSAVSFGHDMFGFGIWESLLQGKRNKASNLMWRLYDALTSVDVLQQSVLRYNDTSMVQWKKKESMLSFNTSYSPLCSFKISNPDLSVATLKILPARGDSPSYFIPTLLHSLLGHKNAIATVFFAKILLANIIVHLLCKMLATDDSEDEENEPSARVKRPCRCFSLAEIQSATDNFHSRNFIGRGGFGNVHKGLIDDRREIVAVKRLKQHSSTGEQQFWTEVEMLSELRHVNIVSLVGYCCEQKEMILVYEYMPNGTLADHLYKLAGKNNDFYCLSWKQRLKICIGAGRGLDYLHTGHGVIHRDVKSSNILLDDNFVAKVSDFGLAKTGYGSDSHSQRSTQVRGTRGYLDPNYCITHKPTKSSDIYSYGVVLLEVLCGRRALEHYDEQDKCRLTTWAVDNISKGQVDQIVLPSLIGEISSESLKTFVRVAKRCLHDEPKKRPAIGHIVMKLELALEQQEKAESLDSNERTGIEHLFSSTGKYHKDNQNIMVPNEKINIVDARPQMENATSSAPNERRNVTDAMPHSDNDRNILASSSKPLANVKTVTTFLPNEQINSTMIKSGRGGGRRKSMMLRISRKLWPWDAFGKTRKSSNKMVTVCNSVSAPISHRTSSIIMDGNTERSDGMISCPAVKSSNEIEELMPVMDYIKGQVDHIVAPALRGEISPDSLRMFVNSAERWLREEPKDRPATIHIVTKIELALQQQEIAEPLPPKDRTSVEGGSSSTGTSLKSNMKLFGPNEKLNIANDLSPGPAAQVPSSTGAQQFTVVVDKKKNIAEDVSPSPAGQVPSSTGTSQKVNMELLGPNKKINVADDGSFSVAEQMPNLRVFSLTELNVATHNFRSDSVLGEGVFGTVYKGCLVGDRAIMETTTVVVKKLNSESMQGFQEWQSDVNFLGRLSHPNLVKLIGYCHEDNQLLLVYEFIAKGSLENHLFRRGADVQSLPWDIRLKILIGAARGMAYLHTLEDAVVYTDFKASNILLSGSYEAKLSDFGLAKLGPTIGHSQVITRVMGTHGYAAPEYAATGHVSVKSDVYGFGVVLLEILTGLRALDSSRPSGQQNLVEWMKPYLSKWRKLKEITDASLEGRYSKKSVLQLAKVALDSLEMEPKWRPSMEEIVHTLERIYSANETPAQTGKNRFFS